MTSPASPRRPIILVLAWSLGLLSLALAVAALLLLVIDLSKPGENPAEFTLESIVSVVIRLAIAVLGVVVVFRQPENAVGWLVWAYGGLGLLDHFTTQYAIHTLGAQPGSLPAGEFAAWLQSWLWIAAFALTAMVFFIFPNGRFLDQRWRLFAQATLLGSALPSPAVLLDSTLSS